MTPKEKAEELALKYHNLWVNGNSIMAKQCALIAVDEMIDICYDHNMASYYSEVKTEIEKL